MIYLFSDFDVDMSKEDYGKPGSFAESILSSSGAQHSALCVEVQSGSCLHMTCELYMPCNVLLLSAIFQMSLCILSA